MVIESRTVTVAGIGSTTYPSDSDDDGPTGERFIPEAMGDSLIEAEHQVRYRFASAAAGGRRVLDAGCGVGWGSLLLHEGGAAAVTGVDISDEALADAAARAPEVRFVRADLEALPFGDDAFDLVTCFEAIEHVADPHRALDELRRVLTPAGVLLVSSPNPHVYRAGNPFHVHEFEPSELLAEVGQRFAHAVVWAQHGHVGSVLRREGDGGEVVTDIGRPGSTETALYSLVVAGDGDLPALTGRAALVSSREIDHLEEAAEALAAQGHAVQAEWERVHAERDAYLAEHERIAEERERVLAEHAAAQAEAARLSSEVTSLRERLRVADRERLREAADRDRALLLLLESEQELARRLRSPLDGPSS